MNTNAIKTGLYLVAGSAVLYIGWKIYKTGADLKTAVSSTVAEAAKVLNDAAQSTKNIADDVVTGIQETFTGNGYQMPAEYNVKQLKFSEWPVTVASFIKSTDQGRGVKNLSNPGDFAGWKVYSDGTVVSPLGEYYKLDLSNPGSIDYTAKEIYFNGLTDWNPFEFKYQWQANQEAPAPSDPFQFG